MFKIFFILFLTIPLLEIYILIRIGNLVGPVPTVALCIFTAVLGAFLLRLQGLQTLARVQAKLQQGEIPATDLLSGLILLLSGVLLLTPGFFTDCIGFLCLIPGVRTYVAANILQRHFNESIRQTAQSSVILDGEFWEEDDPKHLGN